MNLQTYQQCITSLEKQIASRQQQRQQMSLTIQQLDSHLQSQISNNRSIKQQIVMLSRANCELQQILNQKITIIEHLEGVIYQMGEKEKFIKQKVVMLETQKKNLEQEVGMKDGIIDQLRKRVSELEEQNGKNQSLIQGYRNVINQKTKHCAQLQSKLTQLSSQHSTLTTKLSTLSTYNQQLQQQSTSTISQLQSKIILMTQQLQQLKQIHNNQLNTIEFTHGQQINQLKKQQIYLRNQIIHYLQVIDELKQQLKYNKMELQKARQQCQQFNLAKDQIVNQMINEINFLKQQRIQLQKKSTLQLQSVTQEIIKIALNKIIYQQKQKQLQHQIINHQQLNTQLQTKLKQLTLEHNKLSFQNNLYLQKLQNQKSVIFEKDQIINQLQQQLDKINKIVQGLKKDKQSINTNNSIQLIILRQQNIDIERNLLMTQGELQEERINCIQMEQKIKQLTYDKIKSQKTINQLIKLIENNESTIINIQSLLQQSNKIINQLNLTITAKLKEIQALENKKLQWLQKEEEYRKKACQIKTNKSTQRLNRPSTEYYISSRSQSRLRTIHQGFSRSGTGRVMNGRSNQKLQHVYSLSAINNNRQQVRHFVKHNNQNNNTPYYQSSSFNNEQSPQQLQDIHLVTKAQKNQRTSRLNSSQSHQVDLSPLRNIIMKKKDNKLQYIIQNNKPNQNNYELKKNYSLERIHLRQPSD